MGKIRKNVNLWSILSTLIILVIIITNLNIIQNLFNKPNDNWTHIREYLLKDYLINTGLLILFTGVISLIIGTSLGWIITVFEFPLRRIFKWALVLPMAIPPYIGAYTYSGILDYTGIIQIFLRERLGLTINQGYFDIMNIPGAVFIFSILLYPYIYLITKSFLEKQSSSLIENGRVLGNNPFQIFIKILLPISRPAIIGGVSLVVLEVLNDYGVVKYFGIPVFSTAIFKSWFSFGDIDSAIRLSSVLLTIVFFVLILEKILRGRKKYSFSNSKIRPIKRYKIKGISKWIVFLYSLLILSLGFIIPTLQLIRWSIMSFTSVLDYEFIRLIINSISVATITTLLIIIIAIVISNFNRIESGLISKIYSKITSIGYSIPGVVIAMAVILLLVKVDNSLYGVYKIFNSNTPKLVMSTSVFMLIFAYIIRFLAIGFNPIESGFDKIGKQFFEASRTLGKNVTTTFLKVDLIMLKPAIITGFILVFVDILKELPLTLILRPFNFNTLATKSFEYANDEMVQEAAISSMLIIIISAIAIYALFSLENKEVK
ncbi:iron ABC transporter permease [Clostridium sp. D2Q-11]|uniref:Iron ABC transporter permease n=2 Tax=Anaeromonas frigoriresistens TaxID=2683708 RepID=A0A942V0V8_9FIRM|nr:iron ABC transporter permease [Anaeromonas frigoriresistens]MBS4539127.1 iron ABC transporter permease [Anaeromonas frigoriresistens]